ncbi:MAG TPA: hypothetical protein PKD20_00765 [Candidatus Saccharibacteria bacterium]|nr:hypothetical protein [Candidatus Saccharibacteria bacterium]
MKVFHPSPSGLTKKKDQQSAGLFSWPNYGNKPTAWLATGSNGRSVVRV